jgi:hypothetical protein
MVAQCLNEVRTFALHERKGMKTAAAVILAGFLAMGCSREDGRGANSPDESSARGSEKGVTTNFSATGSPLGPLGATAAFPHTVKTGTTAEILTNVKSGQPIEPRRD